MSVVGLGRVKAQGHSRPGRASSNSGHVRYAAECGSKFRTLATPLRAVNRIRLLPSIREVQRMEVAICWPAEYLAALLRHRRRAGRSAQR